MYYESYNYNDYPNFSTNQGFKVVEGDSGDLFIEITKETCLSSNISSGYIKVYFSSYTSNVLFVDGLAEECDESVTVSEDSVNKRIIIESDNKDFLQAILEPSIDYVVSETGEYTCIRTSSVDFINSSGWSINSIRNNKWGDNNVDKYMYYDEEGQFIYIPEEVIKRNHLINDTYKLRIYAYGYTVKETNEFTISEIGCLHAPDSDDITVYQDAISGDIIIESNDKDWLNALTKSRIYLPYTFVDIEYGSSMSLYYGNNYSQIVNLSNQKCTTDTSNTEIDYYYDEQGKYVYIPFVSLLKRDMPANSELTTAYFNAYGYESINKTFNPTIQITKGCIVCPNDITIEEDDEGNIVIHSNDLDYLRALVKTRDNDKYSACVEVQDGYNTRAVFGNYNNSSNTQLILNENEKTVTIPHERIIERNIGNNDSCNIRLKAYGYFEYSEDIKISHANNSAPTGVNTNVDTNGNLTITSADTNWIDILSNSGYVQFFNNNSWIGSIYADLYNNGPFPISSNGQTVTISADRIADNAIPDGTYTLKIYVDGYESLILSQEVTIPDGKGAKIIDPELIKITYDVKNEAVKISFDTSKQIPFDYKDFFEKLASKTINSNYLSKPGSHIEGGRIIIRSNEYNTSRWLQNYQSYYNNKIDYQYEDYKLSTDKKSITIPKKVLYSNGIAKDVSYSVELRAKGYQAITLNNIVFEVGVSPNIPDDINVRFVENEGIAISSSDDSWLDGIVKISDDGSSGLSIGFIPDIYNDGGGYYQYSNHSGYQYSILERKDGKVVMPIEIIYENHIPNDDDYEITVYSYGYRPYVFQDSFAINCSQDVPNDITVRQGEGDILVINSENKDYLRALGNKESSNIYFTYDSQLYRYCGLGGYYIYYDEINEYAYCNMNDVMKNLNGFKNSGYNVDFNNLHLAIETYGYENKLLDYQLKFIECEETEVIAGTTEQLTFGDYDEDDVTWSSSNEAIATIDENGLLKGIKTGNVTITANYNNGEAYDSINFKVTSNTKISLKLQTQDNNTLATVGIPEQLNLIVKNYVLEDTDVVEYISSDTSIATISATGEITFLKPGVVTITAKAIGKTATLKLSVYNVDKSKKVSLTASQTLFEVDEEVSNALVFKAGDDVINNSLITLKYTSSNPNVITVDKNNGAIKGISKGSAKVTVELVGDPSKRKATISLQVVDTIIRSIDDSLTIDTPDPIIASLSDTKDAGKSRVILVDYSDIDKNTKFHINTTNCGKDRNENSVTPKKVSYVSTDSSIASVDKNGYVQFKKAGQVTITVTVASNPKGYEVVSKDIIFKAIDYAPRIETNKFSINKYHATYPSYNVYKIMDTNIKKCSLTELNGDDSSLFEVSYSEQSNKITIKFKDGVTPSTVAAKSYSQLLQFGVDIDGNGIVDSAYKYKVSVIVAQTLPAITPKVIGSYNSFTNENSLELETTIKNASLNTTLIDDNHIKGIEFIGDWADYSYDQSSGKVTILPKDENGKVISSGKVRYTFTGYIDNGYIEKTIKLPIKTTKPAVKLETSTYTLYVPKGTTGSKEIEVRLIDNSKNVINEGTVTLNNTLSITNSSLNNDDFGDDGILKVSIPVEGLKSGKVVLNYKGDRWADSSSISLTINIKVASALPKAKLSATTITLDKNFSTTADIGITIPGSSEVLEGVEPDDFTKGNDDNIQVSYNDGNITVGSSVVGTYKIILTPLISPGETPLTSLPLTVKVVDTKPTVKLKTTSVKFNRLFGDSVLIDFSLTNNKYNVYVDDVEITNYTAGSGGFQGELPVSGSLTEDGKLKLSYDKEANYLDGKYKIIVTPKLKNDNLDEPIDGAPITVSVELYSKYPTAAATVKNSINPFDMNSSSPITVKLTNLVDNVESIEIDDPTFSNLFEIEDLVLKIKESDGFSGIKDGTYKVNAKIKTSLITDGINTTLSIKMARKAPSIKLATPTINVYDTTVGTGTKVGETVIQIPDGYEIDTTNSIIPLSLGYTVELANNGKKFVVKMLDGSKIKAGSTSSFNIKLIWKNDYTNNGKFTKSSTIKMNVKDMSYSINTVK